MSGTWPAGVARSLKKCRSLVKQKELGNVSFKSGNYKEAFEHYSAALNADPELRCRAVVELLSNR